MVKNREKSLGRASESESLKHAPFAKNVLTFGIIGLSGSYCVSVLFIKVETETPDYLSIMESALIISFCKKS